MSEKRKGITWLMDWISWAKKLISMDCEWLEVTKHDSGVAKERDFESIFVNGLLNYVKYPDLAGNFGMHCEAILEYAIREDIERRGLLWEVGHQWHFQIHDGIVAEGYLARILKDATTEWEATADTPLEALALAYLEAVRSDE